MLGFYGLLQWVFFPDGVLIIPLGLMHFRLISNLAYFETPSEVLN